MEEFDLVVIGAGSGLAVSSAASSLGKKVAIIEEGPMGGTCLNRGCIPSKVLIHHADVAETINNAHLFGINARIQTIDFKKIVGRTAQFVDQDAASIERGIRSDKNSTLFKARGKFISEKTLEVSGKEIRGEKVVIAAGTRPSIPPIPGLDSVPFITSDQALRLNKQPKKLIIIGGGYIGAELAHFFGSLGTSVSIVDRGEYLLSNEDVEIARAFTTAFGKKHDLVLEASIKEVEKKGNSVVVTASIGEKEKQIEGDSLLVATGRKPNTDILNVTKGKVETNKPGFVVTNDFLETSASNTWALGDIAGKFMFKHSANLEAEYVVRNCLYGKRERVDYSAMPHAVFSSPQIAGVGERQQDLDVRKANYVVGKYFYRDTGMGVALQDKTGFVKVYADRKTKKILGCHIIGTDASTLIHEVIVAMKNANSVDSIINAVHVHPALPEVVQRAFNNIEW